MFSMYHMFKWFHMLFLSPIYSCFFVSNVLVVLFVLIVTDDSAVSDVLYILIIIERIEDNEFVVPHVLHVPYVLMVTLDFLCSTL